ncbi:MAG: cystathionine beta-synthase [Acidimicrobiales bacterium]|nr:cystathionine beta-synthase [Acidimicrobiales bacterium]
MAELPPKVTDSVLDLIGNTPLVQLRRVGADLECPVLVKYEVFNPGGSVKDRIALAMIEEGERTGALQPGGTIIEPTSGNTGVGLAIVAAQRGYKCIFVVTDKVGPEKVDLLRAYGAEVVVCPVAVAPDDPASYYSTAARLGKERPGAFAPDQYSNPLNPQAHYLSTGPEIWDQTDGRVTHFVAGAGTGGTLSGVARYLKEQNPEVQIIAADPEGSVYSGGSGRPYLVEGVGEDFWPVTYDPSLVDRVIAVSDADSFLTARRVSQQEGLLIGGSCGTAVAAALKVASELTADHMVVVLTPDSGRGYLTSIFNDEWMARFGFLASEGPTVADVVATREKGARPSLVYVQPDDTLRDAVKLMHKHSVSQLPVAQGEMPLANAEVFGSIDELRIMDAAFSATDILDHSVSEVMSDRLPTLGIGEPVERAVGVLDSINAALVLDGGRPSTVLSRADLLTFLSSKSL